MKRGICKHLAIEPDRDGKARFRADTAYRCLAPLPELPALPACITRAHGWHWPPGRSHVFREACAICPTWEAKE